MPRPTSAVLSSAIRNRSADGRQSEYGSLAVAGEPLVAPSVLLARAAAPFVDRRGRMRVSSPGAASGGRSGRG